LLACTSQPAETRVLLVKCGLQHGRPELRERALNVAATQTAGGRCALQQRLLALLGELLEQRAASDAINGLKGKVRARLLKKLFSYVADIPDSDDESDILSDVVQVPVNAIDNKPIEELPPVKESTLSAKYKAACVKVSEAKDRKSIEKIVKYADQLFADGTMPEHERQLLQKAIESRWDEVPEAA
jgi:hypothetical protein